MSEDNREVRKSHPESCICRGLDSVCPDQVERSGIQMRRENLEYAKQARQREARKRLRELQE